MRGCGWVLAGDWRGHCLLGHGRSRVHAHIMNIASAAAARTPLLVLASNIQIAGDDREAFIQTGYRQPATTGI